MRGSFAGESLNNTESWEGLSVGEQIAGLHAVLQEHADAKAAALFLAAIKDPAIQQDEEGNEEISLKYVKSAYEEVVMEYGGLSEKLYSVDQAPSLVSE